MMIIYESRRPFIDLPVDKSSLSERIVKANYPFLNCVSFPHTHPPLTIARIGNGRLFLQQWLELVSVLTIYALLFQVQTFQAQNRCCLPHLTTDPVLNFPAVP